MASDKYISSQEILKRCFQNKTGKLKATSGTYTAQDYFNAVYDSENDSLRISIDGLDFPTQGGSAGYWGEPVVSEELLPSDAKTNTITPVISTSGVISFYYKTDSGWKHLPTLSLKKRQFLDWGSENQEDLMYLIENKKKLEDILNGVFEIKEETIELKSNIVTPVKLNINGIEQEIEDVGDTDGDSDTYYKITINGYVLSTETYANNEALVADKYLVKTVYNKDAGEYGETYIYFAKDEYEYFSSLNSPKNVLEVYYLQNVNPENKGNIKEAIINLTDVEATPVNIDEQGNIQILKDDNDLDGDKTTHYCIKINGYVLSTETYVNNEAPIADKYIVKTVYDRTEGEFGVSYLYFEKDEYEYFSSLNSPKNVLEVYYFQTKTTNTYQSNATSTNVTNILAANVMPTASSNYLNRVVLCTNNYVAENGNEYKKGNFYICILVDSKYVWSSI